MMSVFIPSKRKREETQIIESFKRACQIESPPSFTDLAPNIILKISSFLPTHDIGTLLPMIDFRVYNSINTEKFWEELCYMVWKDEVINYYNASEREIINIITNLSISEYTPTWKYLFYCISKRYTVELIYSCHYFNLLPYEDPNFIFTRAKELDYISTFYRSTDLPRSYYYDTIQLFDFLISHTNPHIRSNIHLVATCSICLYIENFDEKNTNILTVLPLDIVNQNNILNVSRYIEFIHRYGYAISDIEKFYTMLSTYMCEYSKKDTIQSLIEIYSNRNIYHYKDSSLYCLMLYFSELIMFETYYFVIPIPKLLCAIIHAAYKSYNTRIPYSEPVTLYMYADYSRILSDILEYNNNFYI